MMDCQQVELWKLVARAMCYGLWPDLTERRRDRLWAEIEPFIEHHVDEPVDGWQEEYCLCDSFHEWFYEPFGRSIDTQYRGPGGFIGWEMDDNPRRFYNQLRCVVRASLNAIFQNDVGVIGFTVGDVRRVFNGSIPDWFAAQYDGLTDKSPDGAAVRL
jgi:hypothetical protein